nr:PAS domain S-box protein [uncultured Holophaga sp.]
MDISTLLFCNGLLSLAVALVMGVAYRTRRTYTGFSQWTLGMLLMGLGSALFLVRWPAAGWFLPWTRNGLVVASFLMLLWGLRRFRGSGGWPWGELGLLVIFLVLFSQASLEPTALGRRIFLYSLFTGGVAAAAVWVTLSKRPPFFGSSDGILALCLAAFAVISLLRAFHPTGRPAGAHDLLGLGGFDALQLLAQVLIFQILALTLVSMNSQRIEYDLGLSRRELDQKEQDLLAVLENLPNHIYIKDGEGRFLYLNRNAARHLGASSSEVCGRRDAEVFPPEGAEASRRLDALAVQTGCPQAQEILLTDTAGRPVPFWTVVQPISFHGAPAVIGISTDISEVKALQKDVWNSEERLRLITESVRDAIIMIDPRGCISFWNAYAATLFGYTAEEALGIRLHEVLAPEAYREEHRRAFALFQADGRGKAINQTLELTALRKGGEEFPIELSLSGIHREDGWHALGVVRDISQRRASEESFQRLFEHSPAAMLVADFSATAIRFRDLRAGGLLELRPHLDAQPGLLRELAALVQVQEANGNALRLFRADSVEALSFHCQRCFPEETGESWGELMDTLFQGGTECSGEASVRALSGEPLVLELHVSVQPGHEADLSRVLISCIDLTARKAVESERHKLEQELHHLQRLESLGRLASGVSHDMNNVLGAIMGIASILEDKGVEDPSLRRHAELLMQAAIRGRDLVRGLRDFGRKELASMAEVDLNHLARSEAELLERTTLKRVEVLQDLTASPLKVMGDASAISNALMNLCVNAIDAMPRGGRLVLSTRDLGDGFVELAVQDNGEGMSPEVRDRALEPFYTTKAIGKGSGLGLSLVYGTMKAHGGTLELQSRVGEGTRVGLIFPVASGAEATTPAGEAERGPMALSLRILLVDDEELVLSTLQRLLEVLGHRVEIATSGLEALRRLEAGKAVDLVIMDLNMPGLDGVETLHRLRLQRPELPVILSTGHVDERVPELLGRIPRLQLLRKPFNLSELRHGLERLSDAFQQGGERP